MENLKDFLKELKKTTKELKKELPKVIDEVSKGLEKTSKVVDSIHKEMNEVSEVAQLAIAKNILERDGYTLKELKGKLVASKKKDKKLVSLMKNKTKASWQKQLEKHECNSGLLISMKNESDKDWGNTTVVDVVTLSEWLQSKLQ